MSNPKLKEMAYRLGNDLANAGHPIAYSRQFDDNDLPILEGYLQQAYSLGLKAGLSCPGKEIEEAEESGFKRGLDQGIELGRAEENEEIAKFIENNCQFVECEEECECSKVIRSRMKEKK